MSGYLLAVSIGPVQDFIAAARRTRDLWFGSHVLSEISKAVAKSLQCSGADLIFPAPVSAGNLEPESPFNVANKILAEVPVECNPKELAEESREAAKRCWREFAARALEAVGDKAIRLDIWKEQIDDVIEFYAAWVPLNGDYKKSRERVERLLAGRKALRDFAPAKGYFGIPKSSLDGARESVLPETKLRKFSVAVRARIKDNEHLDAIGLVKRLAGRPEEQFVSVTRVAADPWIRGCLKTPDGRGMMSQINNLCNIDFSARVSNKVYKDFPWESDILYPSRLQILSQDPDLAVYKGALGKIQEALKVLMKHGGEPSPYFAVLVADGDHMGAAISAIMSPEEHRRFSRQLSAFATRAKEIIEENHGCLIYSGGDDVLAFIPLDTCIKTARQLHDWFGQIMRDIGANATLSVGVAIGHCLEPLEDLLSMGREAENIAKTGLRPDKSDDRNGLAVIFQTRSGDRTQVRAQWDTELDRRLEGGAEMFLKDQLPDKVAFDLRALAGDYEDWPKERLPQDLLYADTRCLLEKKKARGQKLPVERISELLSKVKEAEDLSRLAAELVIARHLAGSLKDANPGVNEPKEGNP